MKKLLVASLLAAGAPPTPAWAQDADQSFTGPRAELRAGADFSRVKVLVEGTTDPILVDDDETGITFAGELGYDAQLGSDIRLGAYGGVEFSSLGRCFTTFAGDEACLEAYRTITAGARVGLVRGPGTMLYAKGGYTRTRLEATYENPIVGIDRIREEDDVDGFHVGGGVEVALGRRAYGRLDYAYTKYDEGRFAFDGVEARADTTRHQVLLGFGLRF